MIGMSLFSWSFSKDDLIIQQVQLYDDDMLNFIYVWHLFFMWNNETGTKQEVGICANSRG